MEKNNDLMAGKGEKGEWITVNGSHVFVEDGQSVEDAVNKQFNKKKTADKNEQEKRDPEIEEFSKKIGMGYKDAEKMHKELQEEDEAYKNFLNNKTDEDRNDKYTTGNPDNINKQTTPGDISTVLSNYKGSGQVDLVMPGGKWAQIRPQKDGSYLVRSSNGNKYVESADAAKKELNERFNSSTPKQDAKQDNSKLLKRKKEVESLIEFYTARKEENNPNQEQVIKDYQNQLEKINKKLGIGSGRN